VVSQEFAADLLGWAVRLSGRARPPTRASMPTLVALSPEGLAREVCPKAPDSCRGLVAAYDTDRQRIVNRQSLDMGDPTDQSFIVHELVHGLQQREMGAAVEESCESILAAEREAYEVQNQYLTRFKQWQRVGEVMRFTFCNHTAAASAAESTVRFNASTSPITATRQALPASQPRP